MMNNNQEDSKIGVTGLTDHDSTTLHLVAFAKLMRRVETEEQIIKHEIRTLVGNHYKLFAVQPAKVAVILKQPNVGGRTSLGNEIFLKIIIQQKDRFSVACPSFKRTMAEAIVDELDNSDTPIRFADTETTVGGPTLVIATRESAIARTTDLLRVAASQLKLSGTTFPRQVIPSYANIPVEAKHSSQDDEDSTSPGSSDVVFGHARDRLDSYGNKLYRKLLAHLLQKSGERTTNETASAIIAELERIIPTVRFFHRYSKGSSIRKISQLTKHQARKKIVYAINHAKYRKRTGKKETELETKGDTTSPKLSQGIRTATKALSQPVEDERSTLHDVDSTSQQQEIIEILNESSESDSEANDID